MKDCIFYVISQDNENIKLCSLYVENDKVQAEMKRISELSNFLEFSNDNGEYRFLSKTVK